MRSADRECVPGGGGMSMGRLWKAILIERDGTVGSVALPATMLDKSSARWGCFM